MQSILSVERGTLLQWKTNKCFLREEDLHNERESRPTGGLHFGSRFQSNPPLFIFMSAQSGPLRIKHIQKLSTRHTFGASRQEHLCEEGHRFANDSARIVLELRGPVQQEERKNIEVHFEILKSTLRDTTCNFVEVFH